MPCSDGALKVRRGTDPARHPRRPRARPRSPRRARPHGAQRLGHVPARAGPTSASRRISSALPTGAVLTRGLGRSYGDASLPAPGGPPVAGSVLADRVLSFDLDSGQCAGGSRRDVDAAQSPLAAARLVHAGDARHALGHARRHGRGRRARQEPSCRRHLRRARPLAAHAPRRRPPDRMQRRAGARAVPRHARRHGAHRPRARGRPSR